MTPLRALLVPFHFTSLVLITTLALLLAAAIHFDTSGFLWLAPAFIITSWVFKYAFAMLEHIADGESYAPVASIEMLSPFEQRPFVLLLVMLAAGQAAWRADNVIAWVLVGLLLVIIPAFIGLLGATRRVTLSLNPLAILQTVRGMGAWYLLVLFVIAATVAMVIWAVQSNWWVFILCWQIGLSVLLVFSLIGGTMYYRRIELGHEPRISPERMAVHVRRDHDRRLKRMLDDMYNAVRLGDLVRAMNGLEHWLSSADEEAIALDCRHIHSTILSWDDADMLTASSRALFAALVVARHPHMLEELVVATLQAQPGFTFKSESELLPAVHALQEAGGNKPALQLMENFVNAFPAQVTTGITALRQRLEDVARKLTG